MKKYRFTKKGSIMKLNRILGSLAVGAMLWACSDNDGKDVVGGASGDSGITAVTDWEVAGVSQKGPFVTGSAVTVQELDGVSLKQTGKSFKGSIKSDKGDFAIKDINLESQYAILEATGYYRDEISGKKSSSTVTLRALTDLSDRKKVNINLLTHLEYERVMYLVNKKKMSIADAKAQAEKEVLASFGIVGDFGESEDLNIFESGDGNAALLAVSVLMQGDVDVAGLTERMGEFSISLAEGGSWDDVDTKTEIADWACDIDLKGSLSKVRKNVEGWKYADSVPEFEKYVSNFWWDNYGLGVCNKKRESETKRNINKLSALYNEYFICENGRWVIPGDEPAGSSSSSKDVEPVEGSSSSSVDGSSSSLYDPFARSSSSEPEDTIPPLPAELDFFDSTYSFVGYRSFGEGKQEVWFLNAIKLDSDQEGRDSVASALVKVMGEHGFSFEAVVNNDSVGDAYDTLSYVYSAEKENLVYRISLTKWRGAGMFYSSYYTFSVKVVLLKDGFEEMPTTDYSSLRFFEDFPEELAFMEEYSSTKVRADYDDDSLMIRWQFRRNVDSTSSQQYQFLPDLAKEKAAEEAFEPFLEALPDNGFTFVKSDSLGKNSNMSNPVVARYFYEMETPAAKFVLQAEVGTVGYPFFGVTYTFKYGYTVDIKVYYKQKPERKGKSE